MADLAFQVRDLTAKNLELQAAVKARDAELRDLKELAEAYSTMQSQDVQTMKIIDLAKKNRLLTLALEKERQRTAKLQADLKAMGATSAAGPTAGEGGLDAEAVEEIARSMVEQAAEAAEAAAKEATMWRERAQAQTNKMAQLEQKAFALEIDNKKLARALQREVGEEVPLARVLDEVSSDWKGRREQIIRLQDQVKALKAAQGLAPESRTDLAAKKVMAKVGGAKAAELERLNGELAVARAELESLKFKYDSALSRRKILEAEMGAMREKVAVVLDKTANDDRLIGALRTELAAARKAAAGVPGPATRSGDEDKLWQEVGSLRRRVAEQEAQIDRQEAIITALQQQALQQRQRPGSGGAPSDPGSMRHSQTSGLQPDAGQTQQQQQQQQQHQQQQAAEQQLRLAEVEVRRLQELVGLLQQRIEQLEEGEEGST